jgi:hypothetical protein
VAAPSCPLIAMQELKATGLLACSTEVRRASGAPGLGTSVQIVRLRLVGRVSGRKHDGARNRCAAGVGGLLVSPATPRPRLRPHIPRPCLASVVLAELGRGGWVRRAPTSVPS